MRYEVKRSNGMDSLNEYSHSYEEVKQNIWKSFFTNYFRLFLQMIIGLLLFRFLYQSLEAEEFGFWVLLWSIMGYTKFLDFGLGITVQKCSAQLIGHQGWLKLQKIIVTVFYIYFLIACVIILFVYLLALPLINLLQVPSNYIAFFHELFVYFFLWVALTYPLGLFQEILVGQQRIALLNTLSGVTTFLNFILIVLFVHLNLGLKALFTASLSMNLLLLNVLAGYFALRKWKNISLNPKYFSLATLRHNINFSFYAYLNTIATTVIASVDRIAIGFFLSLSILPLYQAGAKIGELFSNLTRQLADTLSPASAHLHAKGDVKGIRELMLSGIRYSLLMATPLYIIFAFFIPDIMKLLTGNKALSSEALWTAQILLLWNYTMAAITRVFKAIFFMCGKEKMLTVLSLLETSSCILLIVSFSLSFRSILSVAFGLLLPTAIISWLFLWPHAATQAKMSSLQLAKETLWPIWISCLPLIAFVACIRLIVGETGPASLIEMGLELSCALLIAVACLWFWALKRSERDILIKKLHSLRRYTNSRK